MAKYYITKYALTKGIYESEGETFADSTDPNPKTKYIKVKGGFLTLMRLGTEAFASKADALKNAAHRATREMLKIERKLESLQSVRGAWERDLSQIEEENT